ncbi:MAG: universal stress protein [Acidimicrobiales bacterium]
MSTFRFDDPYYNDRRPLARSVAESRLRQPLIARGTIVEAHEETRAGRNCFVCTLDDGTGQVDLVFTGRRRIPGFEQGVKCTAKGTVASGYNGPTMLNPLYRLGDVAFPESAQSRRDAEGNGAGFVVTDCDSGGGTVAPAGHFRIYLGAAPGVGKTVAMLDEAQRRRRRGTDIVIGLVESHGRPITKSLMAGLEIIPRRKVEYRGTTLEEMDLEAVLRRRPKVVLVDELAHTNVPMPGGHEKRWQDVETILEAGIDVISTVNIQHLESMADAVERMTGVKVRERVPDSVVRKANQLELVDSSPEQLRRRMLHGNIYPADKVPQALDNFFRTDNLSALRELALRFVADETEEELLSYLRRSHPDVAWETTERIMVGVTEAPGAESVIRRAARISSRLKAELHVVHVRTPDVPGGAGSKRLDELRRLAGDVGGRWHELDSDDPAAALVDFARENQVTQLVIGSSKRSRWQQLRGGGSTVRRLSKSASDAGIDVHVIARALQKDRQS